MAFHRVEGPVGRVQQGADTFGILRIASNSYTRGKRWFLCIFGKKFAIRRATNVAAAEPVPLDARRYQRTGNSQLESVPAYTEPGFRLHAQIDR
jgi:hypothetical protein